MLIAGVLLFGGTGGTGTTINLIQGLFAGEAEVLTVVDAQVQGVIDAEVISVVTAEVVGVIDAETN